MPLAVTLTGADPAKVEVDSTKNAKVVTVTPVFYSAKQSAVILNLTVHTVREGKSGTDTVRQCVQQAQLQLDGTTGKLRLLDCSRPVVPHYERQLLAQLEAQEENPVTGNTKGA